MTRQLTGTINCSIQGGADAVDQLLKYRVTGDNSQPRRVYRHRGIDDAGESRRLLTMDRDGGANHAPGLGDLPGIQIMPRAKQFRQLVDWQKRKRVQRGGDLTCYHREIIHRRQNNDVHNAALR